MIDLIDSALKDLKTRKQSEFIDHEKLVMATFSIALPKQSKTLNTNLIKKIFSIDEELNLILVGHLYLEKLLNGILTENLKGFEILDKRGVLNSFYKKIMFLKSEQITPNQILDDLLIFNQLRNMYAHELNYNIADFDIFKLSFLKKYASSFQIKRRSNKRILNRILVRHSIFHLLLKLTSTHSYLHLIDEK